LAGFPDILAPGFSLQGLGHYIKCILEDFYVPFDLLDALDELERRRAFLRFRSIQFGGVILQI
jgi:hypothetical protein